MKLYPYPTCKPSDVSWIGDVPAHWEVRRLKYAVPINPETLSEDTDPEYIFDYMDINSVGAGYMVNRPVRQRFGNAPSRARRAMRTGDTAVSTVRTYLKAAYHLQRDWPDLIASTGFAILRPPATIVPALLGHIVQSDAFVRQVVSNSVGVAYPAISETKLGTLSLALPPLPEQAAIVRYLDYVDRRIRRYVTAKRKLTALLEEEKQAVVNRAVTRGLDPNVRLKPSAIEWLGDVPEHWDVRRLKTLCSMKSGEGITAESIETTGEYPVYGGNGLRGYASNYTHDGAFALIGRQGALCGNVHIARGQFWASEHAVVASLQPAHVLDWFGAVLQTMNLNQYSIAAAQPGLAVERILNLWLPIPPPEEQATIATSIGLQTTDTNAAIARTRRQIDLVQEYRTRLIADVVTGKLDVREAAAHLPDEDDDKGDPIDEGAVMLDNMDGGSFDESQPTEEELTIESEVGA